MSSPKAPLLIPGTTQVSAHAPHPQCDSLIERMIELRMELARKPSNNQETQQAKRLGNQNVRGVLVKIKEETQFTEKEKSYERSAEEFGERGGMVMVGGARSGAAESFGGDDKTFGGDHKEVTSDVLPGVSTVSLSFVSKESTIFYVYVYIYNSCVFVNIHVANISFRHERQRTDLFPKSASDSGPKRR